MNTYTAQVTWQFNNAHRNAPETSMTTSLKIAALRARMVARTSARRAVEILIAAGVAFEQAVHFVLNALRAGRANA